MGEWTVLTFSVSGRHRRGGIKIEFWTFLGAIWLNPLGLVDFFWLNSGTLKYINFMAQMWNMKK
jgi:hypothetical protein